MQFQIVQSMLLLRHLPTALLEKAISLNSSFKVPDNYLW